MHKALRIKSIFFLLVFCWCILTPAVVVICNIDTDMSALFSMNEEETSDTYKLGAKEYNAPSSSIPKFLLVEFHENKTNFFHYTQFWETVTQENVSPPPEYL